MAVTEWEPATEAEAAMRDALRANDQELYFRILARTDLLLPVSAEALAGQAPMGWGTWTTGGRTHVLAFTSEEAWLTRFPREGSVHRRTFPELPVAWRDPALGARWARVREIRRVVTGALELERREKRIGASLQACPTVHLGPEDRTLLEGLDLAELAITSGIVLADGPAPVGAFTLEDVPGVAVVPGLAEGEKCQRCWQVLAEVTESPEHLCRRCTDAVPAVAA